MNFLASFDEFMTGNGIWIVVGVLALSLVVTVVFLILNIVKAKKQKALEEAEKVEEQPGKEEKVGNVKEEPLKEEEQKEEVKEEPKEEQKEEPEAETKKTSEKPKKKASSAKNSKPAEAEKAQKEHSEKQQVKEEKPMTKETYGVTYDKENRQWVVKKTGSARASKRCATKAEALEYAEKLSEAKGANLRVHKKDGKFQKR